MRKDKTLPNMANTNRSETFGSAAYDSLLSMGSILWLTLFPSFNRAQEEIKNFKQESRHMREDAERTISRTERFLEQRHNEHDHIRETLH